MIVPSSQAHRHARRRAALGIVLAALLLTGPAVLAQSGSELPAEQAARFAEQAAAWRGQLSAQVMPFWYDRTIDQENGGYLLPEAQTPDKRLADQARLMWSFARAHRQGIRDPQRDYLAAAANGYRFLRANFLDRLHGGYYWMTSRVGRPIGTRKYLFGQACMLYALVEYYRASGDGAALQDAIDLYRTLMEQARDPVNGGWSEHFEADWRPLVDPETTVPIGIAGLKSGAAHLELMTGLTELLLATREAGAPAGSEDLGVEDALGEALEINLTHFFPEDPGQAYPYRQPDWQRPLGAKFREISFGRNVEFAWRMAAAQRARGDEPLWQRFDAILQQALKYGFDHERGGLYGIGFGNRPALATEKTWWAQAEMLAALTTAVAHQAVPSDVEALDQLLDFLTTYQIDPDDGIWFDAVQADGSPWRRGKAHDGKTGFHELRAVVKFADTFGAS